MIGQKLKSQLSKYNSIYAPSRKQLDLASLDFDVEMFRSTSKLIFSAQNDGNSIANTNINKERFFLENGLILKKIIENNPNISQVIYLSSGGIYKDSKNLLNEDSKLKSLEESSLYFQAKLMTESLMKDFSSKMNICVMRLFTVYGKNLRSQRLFPILQRKIENGETIEISMDGGDILRPINVEDVVQNIQYILQNEISGTYNIAGPELLSLREIIARISKVTGKQAKITITEKEPHCIAPDIIKMSKFLKTPNTRFNGNWQL